MLASVIGVSIALLCVLAVRPSLAEQRGGRLLAFVALGVLPIVATWGGLEAHVERSKSTVFCTSCHAMEPYGKSLVIDDPLHLPASHFQNSRVPRDQACF